MCHHELTNPYLTNYNPVPYRPHFDNFETHSQFRNTSGYTPHLSRVTTSNQGHRQRADNNCRSASQIFISKELQRNIFKPKSLENLSKSPKRVSFNLVDQVTEIEPRPKSSLARFRPTMPEDIQYGSRTSVKDMAMKFQNEDFDPRKFTESMRKSSSYLPVRYQKDQVFPEREDDDVFDENATGNKSHEFIKTFKKSVSDMEKEIKQSNFDTYCTTTPTDFVKIKNPEVPKEKKLESKVSAKKIYLSQPSSGHNSGSESENSRNYSTSAEIIKKYKKLRHTTENASTTETLDSCISNINLLIDSMMKK